jgi:predicted phosphohydrolase
MVSIQIVSDLHLEFRKTVHVVQPAGEVLCLLGDICACGTLVDFRIFVEFLKLVTKQYKLVLHVAGNHEYYASSNKAYGMKNTIDIINKRFCALQKIFPNYRFLNNKSIKYRGVLFVGTTLWTNIPVERHKDVVHIMNDYSNIYTEAGRLTPAYVTSMHLGAVRFIKRMVARAKIDKVPVVLLTHHKPFWDNERKNAVNICYEVDLGGLIRAPIILAAHGHTHKKMHEKRNGVLVFSNPLGYPREHTSFNAQKGLKIG